jgi:hypothetical protein
MFWKLGNKHQSFATDMLYFPAIDISLVPLLIRPNLQFWIYVKNVMKKVDMEYTIHEIWINFGMGLE